MGKSASSQIFAIVKLLAMLVVGVFVFLFLRSTYLKTKSEKESDAEFKKRGAFASFGRFLFGDEAFADTGENPTTTDKETEQKRQKDLEDIADLNEEAQRLAKEEKERRKEAERQAEKDINTNPNQDVAARIDEIEKTIKHQQEEEKKKGKDTTFDRTKDDFKIFRFAEPIKTPKGTLVDFAIKVQDKNRPESKTDKIKRKEEAIRQVKELGLGSKDSKGRDVAPITSLSQKTLDRIQKDPSLARKIELIQKRRLGLR